MKSFPIERVLWGLVIIAVGSLMLADTLDIADYDLAENLFRLWPLFIVIPGLSALVKGRFFWGGLLTVGGSAFLLSNFTDLNAWEYVWPAIIIVFGLSLLFKPSWSNMVSKGVSTDDHLNDEAVFGGSERTLTSKNFKGGKVEAVFGGIKIDLRQVELAEDEVRIEVNAVFGGVEVLVDPKKYKVVAKGDGVFGAWTNKYEASTKDKPVLVITGAAVFGGVEIK